MEIDTSPVRTPSTLFKTAGSRSRPHEHRAPRLGPTISGRFTRVDRRRTPSDESRFESVDSPRDAQQRALYHVPCLRSGPRARALQLETGKSRSTDLYDLQDRLSQFGLPGRRRIQDRLRRRTGNHVLYGQTLGPDRIPLRLVMDRQHPGTKMRVHGAHGASVRAGLRADRRDRTRGAVQGYPPAVRRSLSGLHGSLGIRRILGRASRGRREKHPGSAKAGTGGAAKPAGPQTARGLLDGRARHGRGHGRHLRLRRHHRLRPHARRRSRRPSRV